MESDEKFYIERIALAARKKFFNEKNKEIIKKFSFIDLKELIDFFGGELKTLESADQPFGSDNKPTDYIEKINDEKFIIFHRAESNSLKILHELGHAFLHLPDYESGVKFANEGKSSEDTEADLFARAFLMPREEFEQVVIENINDGQCNIQKVADKYGLNYLDVLKRGSELNIWE